MTSGTHGLKNGVNFFHFSLCNATEALIEGKRALYEIVYLGRLSVGMLMMLEVGT